MSEHDYEDLDGFEEYEEWQVSPAEAEAERRAEAEDAEASMMLTKYEFMMLTKEELMLTKEELKMTKEELYNSRCKQMNFIDTKVK